MSPIRAAVPPFSGRGWVVHSGAAIGDSFGSAVAGSLKSARSGIHDELGGIGSEFDQFAQRDFDIESTLRAESMYGRSAVMAAGQSARGEFSQHFHGLDALQAAELAEYADRKRTMAWRGV